MSWLLRIAHPIRRRLMALVGWRTRGVKVMVFDAAGRVLLVRHAYGRSDLYMLPGGGVARGETAAIAAARELREETGISLRDVTPIGQFEARAEGRRDTVHLFAATTGDDPQPDRREVIEACFFALDHLPDALSPATRRRLDERAGRRAFDGRW